MGGSRKNGVVFADADETVTIADKLSRHKFTEIGDEAGLFFHMLVAMCFMADRCSDGKASLKKI
jgi:hypothetical protein